MSNVPEEQTEWLAARFEESRPRLRAIARRMLGSVAEADDVVQDVWLRLSGSDTASIDNLGGWFTTVVSRLCLDRLRRRRPSADPDTVATVASPASEPADQAELADAVGSAMQVVLDALGPAERIAFVLHDVFAVPFEEIAPIVERSPAATRQLASRARRRVQGGAVPPAHRDPVRHREVVEAFLRAAQGGDLAGLLRVLHPDVVLRPDAVALRMGSLRETTGADAVAAALSGGAQAAQLAVVDGLAAFVWAPGGQVRGIVDVVVIDDRIVALDVTGDAQRIAAREIVVL
jgi:RNA polymerase sigma factor (sigma-70 family)